MPEGSCPPTVEDEWEVTALPTTAPPPPRPTPRLTEERPPPSASAAVPANSEPGKANETKQMCTMDDAEEDMDEEQTVEEDADAVTRCSMVGCVSGQEDEEDDDYGDGASISGDQWSDEGDGNRAERRPALLSSITGWTPFWQSERAKKRS